MRVIALDKGRRQDLWWKARDRSYERRVVVVRLGDDGSRSGYRVQGQVFLGGRA